MGIRCASFCCEKMGEVFYAKKQKKFMSAVRRVLSSGNGVLCAGGHALPAGGSYDGDADCGDGECLSGRVGFPGGSVPWGILADVIGYRRTLQICAAVSFLSKIVFWKAEGFAGFLTERILLGIVTAGLLTASAVCTVLAGGFSAGLTRRLGAKRVTLLCFLLAAAGCGVLAGTENFLLSVGAVLLVQVCFRMFWPLQMSIQKKRAAPGNRATALSMNSLLMNLTACSVNPVFGKLADAGLPLVMTAGFLCCLAGAVLLPFFGDKKEKRAGKEESVVR